MKNKKGFTIVELVIVIAVIAILAAVLIPTFTTVTANARASAALSTAKNAQTAVLGNSEGSMPELTLVAVSNDKDAYAEYAFIVNERKLESVKLNSISNTSDKIYPVAATSTRTNNNGTAEDTTDDFTVTTYTYTVFVTADYFDSAKTANVKDAVEGLVRDVLDRQINARTKEDDGKTGSLTAVNTTDAGKEYATWTYVPQTADATKEYVLNVYYNADIPETAVVFFAQ